MKALNPLFICFILFLVAGCISAPPTMPATPEAVVSDAGYGQEGHINFEVVNTGTVEATIDYTWTLTDPATGETIGSGNGSVTLGPDEFEGASASIDHSVLSGDTSDSIICVNLSVDGRMVHQYHDQIPPITAV